MCCVCVLLRFALSPLVHGAVMLKVMCELCAISYAITFANGQTDIFMG